MSEKTSYHSYGEKEVKGMIKNGRDYYEYQGLEDNPHVAETMAYAAKPLIDDTLETLENEPNNLAIATVKGEQHWLSNGPGVVTPKGRNISYEGMKMGIERAHQAADSVQSGYYEKVAATQKALDEARADA